MATLSKSDERRIVEGLLALDVIADHIKGNAVTMLDELQDNDVAAMFANPASEFEFASHMIYDTYKLLHGAGVLKQIKSMLDEEKKNGNADAIGKRYIFDNLSLTESAFEPSKLMCWGPFEAAISIDVYSIIKKYRNDMSELEVDKVQDWVNAHGDDDKVIDVINTSRKLISNTRDEGLVFIAGAIAGVKAFTAKLSENQEAANVYASELTNCLNDDEKEFVERATKKLSNYCCNGYCETLDAIAGAKIPERPMP